ncbi:MAG: hypothetical protein J6R20_07615 [Clostridia bacterium]|nr:hypothetical protein [Clostridia bacterium]
MIIIRKIWSALTLPLLLITLLTSPVAKSSETADLVSQNVFVFDKALIMGQGITTDGEYFYTSGSITALNLQALGKFTVEGMDIVKSRINPLPDVCEERGNNHIGGISYYDGKIYASVEGGDECYACIVTFDCETLEPTGEVYDLPNELYDDGIPWLAVDTETGLLYATKWNDAEYLRVYDINDGMKNVDNIRLSETIHRIQGGEIYNGTLYLSNDIHGNGDFKRILSVDVVTGEVKVVAERNVGGENVEAEGITFVETADGAQMHVLDYNKLIGIFVHHYKVDF